MKTTNLILASLLAVAPLRAEIVNFPAGNFENGTASSWTTSQTGLGAVASTPSSGGNTFGQVAVTGTGTATLSTATPSAFLPQSLYVVSLDVDLASLLAAGNTLTIDVVDGNGNVIKELNQSELLDALGIGLGTVSGLTTDLTALTGKTDLTNTLQSLLSQLTGNTALLGSVQDLVGSLVGANPSVLSKVEDLLQSVIDGTVNPASLTNGDIGSLLGLPALDPIVTQVQQLLTFATGNEGPIQALVNVLGTAAGTAGDLGIVNNLLTTLVGDDGVVGDVADILAYALSDTGLLSTLTNTLTGSLLGIVNPSASGFQNVQMIFSTGASVPAGPIGVKLNAGATLGVGQTTKFDNVAIQRFALGTTNTNSVQQVVVNSDLPVVTVKGKKVRQALSRKQVIKGTALSVGSTNSITKVQYRVRGGGVKGRGFKTAKGTTNWKITVPAVSGNARVIVHATDAQGQVSNNAIVYLRK